MQSSDETEKKFSLACLVNLSTNNEFRALLVSNGTLSYLAKAVDLSSNPVEVVRFAVHCMGNLAENDCNVSFLLGEMGMIKKLLDIVKLRAPLRNSPASTAEQPQDQLATLREDALTALYILAKAETNKAIFLNCRIMNLFMELLSDSEVGIVSMEGHRSEKSREDLAVPTEGLLKIIIDFVSTFCTSYLHAQKVAESGLLCALLGFLKSEKEVFVRKTLRALLAVAQCGVSLREEVGRE